MLQHRTIDSYHFGFYRNLTESQLRTLTASFRPTAPDTVSVLGGRTSVTRTELHDIGAVIVKHYRRGGWLRHFIQQHYLNVGKNRALREFELLQLAAEAGINVPQNVAYAYCGRLLYRAWLITREIRRPLSLVQLSQEDEAQTKEILKSVGRQISLLIQNGIWHIDLHPGNVVVDQAGKVYLLDFDKGQPYPGNKKRLQARYLARWQRAVAKHDLPVCLTELFNIPDIPQTDHDRSVQ
jgi:3-deoxy-D-manno-octulosonic acid kinase